MSQQTIVLSRDVAKAVLLSSPRAKLARADEHLDELYRETDGWGRGDPFVVTRESDADGREHLFRVRFKTEPDVWRWSLILGDALHNLRAALDRTVYALAIAQTGKDPPTDERDLAFPICSEPKFFPKQCKRRLGSLSQATQAAIEKAQPYNRSRRWRGFTPLWFLAQLHDIDKHRLSHLSVTAAVPDELATSAPTGRFRADWNDGPLSDGAPLLRLALADPDPDVHVDIKATGAVVLDLEGLQPMSLYWVTQHIRREVTVVCRYLSRFFP